MFTTFKFIIAWKWLKLISSGLKGKETKIIYIIYKFSYILLCFSKYYETHIAFNAATEVYILLDTETSKTNYKQEKLKPKIASKIL